MYFDFIRQNGLNPKAVSPKAPSWGKGYRVIISGDVSETENGNMIFDDVLVEYRGEDWAIQLKATETLEKILGLHTETSAIENEIG